MTHHVTTLAVLCVFIWQDEKSVDRSCGFFDCPDTCSLNRVSMLLLVLRWSYGKVLLLPSCSAAQPCPSSSLKTSGTPNPGPNSARPHPHPDSLHRPNLPRGTCLPRPRQSRQWCRRRWVVFGGGRARPTGWTPSSQSVRQAVIDILTSFKVSRERAAGDQTGHLAPDWVVYRAGFNVQRKPAVN